MKPNDPGRQVGGGHYGGTKWQHWDWVEWNGLGYQEGQISLYVLRWRKKEGIEDLEKAIHHTEKLLEQYHDPELKRRNRRNDRWETKTHKTDLLFETMGTEQWEKVVIWNLIIWQTHEDLESVAYLILKLKMRGTHEQ